jgi:2-amino-4-hydroxy-6-hydroxymethyldihydropteridine diphosphokinase
MTVAFIGVGSNLGDRVGNLASALRELAAQPGVGGLEISHAYETEPWGVADQPAFANAVARIDYHGEANALLGVLKEIEQGLGRTQGERYGPRVIDLDILLFGDEEWDAPQLTIPHPHLLERDFTVTPLLANWPDARLPDGSPVTRDRVVGGAVTADMGLVPGFDRLSVTGETVEPPPVVVPADAGPAAPPEGEAEQFQVGDWVAVGPSRYEYGAVNAGTDFDLLMYESFLTEAGIQVRFYPNRPNEGAPVYPGIGRTVRLMVPRSQSVEAERLIDEISGGGTPAE